MASPGTAYRSPLRLVRHAAEEANSYSVQTLARARKKILAEMALTGDELLLDNVPYSRHDAATLLDGLTAADWKLHTVIDAHPGLLQFLEKARFDDAALRAADDQLYNTAFVQAVSPYFAHSFNTVSGRLLREGNLEELCKLLRYQGYISAEHLHEGFQRIRNHLAELNATLRNLSWEKFAADESVLHFLFDDQWKGFINSLPPAFAGQRDELVETVTNLVLHFQHKATWHYLHQVLLQLKAIETNSFNREEVQRIDAIIYENSLIEGGHRKKSTDSSPAWRNAWWAVWLVIVLVRFVASNTKTDSGTYDFKTNPQTLQQLLQPNDAEQKNEPVLLSFLDSLSRKPQAATPLPNRLPTGAQPFSAFADSFANSGGYRLRLVNNSGYDAVLFGFDGRASANSVYVGALSRVAAAYVRNGDTLRLNLATGGQFHLIFGSGWGSLPKPAELSLTGERNQFYPDGRKHTLFVYEFFNSSPPLPQPYLHRRLVLSQQQPDTGALRLLNTPDNAEAKQLETTIILAKTKKGIAATAAGRLHAWEQATTNDPATKPTAAAGGQ